MNVCIYVGMYNKLVSVLEDTGAFLGEINTDTYMQSVCVRRCLYVNFYISLIVIVFKSECPG